MAIKFNSVVIHYDEIGLKGDNRSSFEMLLINNIKAKSEGLFDNILRESGQITINLKENLLEEDIFKMRKILEKMPGIAYFSFAIRISNDIDKIKKISVDFLKEKSFDSFRISSERHDKSLPLSSNEMNVIIGSAIVDSLNKKVNLKTPDVNLKVEVNTKSAYLSVDNISGVGGLPVDSSQKVVVLLSGGFDSPVAAFSMMKRGCSVILVHFRNENQNECGVESKIRELAEKLSCFQSKTVLYTVLFGDIQREIIIKAKAEKRMLVYRRFMLKIASKIADFNKAKFLVLGDSLSQVASQTLANLEATYNDSPKPIFSPLIGMNKKEIMEISKKIETYDISSRPYGDCCSYFLPKHPVLNAKSDDLSNIESDFEIKSLIDKAVKEAIIEKF
jgi:thiamine biosynthesis protein ThiI